MERGKKYDNEWFRERARNSIHKLGPNTWDYSDSLLLYISSGVKKYEDLQDEDTPYFNLVTKPEREYLQSIAKNVVDALPPKFEYIDLGPGTEHKEQFFFDELRKQEKDFVYVPVDISEEYLKLAEKHAKNQGIETRPVQAAFEELPEVLWKSDVPRFVNIGLTFSNYEPQAILKLLKEIAGEDGFAFINSQMRDRVDMDALQSVYAEDVITLADIKLEFLGLNPDVDVTPRTATLGVQSWCMVVNPSPILDEKGVVRGDKMLVFQSLRYTPEQLELELRKASDKYQVFDNGSSFIAALIS